MSQNRACGSGAVGRTTTRNERYGAIRACTEGTMPGGVCVARTTSPARTVPVRVATVAGEPLSQRITSLCS